MGTSENMKRIRGRAVEFMVVMVSLVGSGLSQTVPSSSPCPGGAVHHNLEQPDYEESVRPVADIMASFVHSFLHTVQPRPFPKDLVLEIVQDPGNTVTNQDFVQKVLMYEIGFLVCLAIGILYIVLMPIVGLFFVCCRCCGNCGGKMHQKEASSINCRRRMLYWATFVTTASILAGNICMFRSNEALKMSVENSTVELNKAINNINTFLTAVPQQAQLVINESYLSIQEVIYNLDGIGTQLGNEIQKQFNTTFTPALRSLSSMDQEVVYINEIPNKLNRAVISLESSVNVIQSNISALKKEIDTTLSRPDCFNCATMKPEINDITVDTSINTPSLSELEKALNDVKTSDLDSKIEKVETMFLNIPNDVASDTKNVAQSTKEELEQIKKQISSLTTQLQLSELNKVLSELKQVQSSINMYTPEVEHADYIRWCVCITLCCLILLVVVCNFSGLLLGPLGLKPKVDPTKRSCMSNCGGTLFMMGAGFSFLMSWLFMILVVILFLIGGNAYTLLCKPWKNGELLKLIDTPGVVPGLDLRAIFGNNTTISSIYQDCEENKPMWSAFNLNQQINLDDLLNISKYTGTIEKDFENFNIELSPVTFLTPVEKDKLKKFSSTANSINFTTPVKQINKFYSINLNTKADKLDALATATIATTQQELIKEAQTLRKIQTDIETIIFPKVDIVNSTIDELRTSLEGINAMVEQLLRNVEAAQIFSNEDAAHIVKTLIRKFLDCQLGYFSTFAEWAKMMITQEMGRCGPVAGAVNSAEIIFCSNLVESLNAFWFSLGWCVTLFIPSIIFSIKLAKYYRRMKYVDVYDDPINMNYIPRAQMKFN